MPAVLTIRDSHSGATIERSAPLAEQMIARDPDRFEIVEAIQPSPLSRDPLAPLDSRRRRAGLMLRAPSPKVRGKTLKPAPLMRKVCKPGTEACPRNL